MRKSKIGLIVNPIAGMGGKVGLKGTDGTATLMRAKNLGAVPLAGKKTQQALSQLRLLEDRFEILTSPGEMGEKVSKASGLIPTIVTAKTGATTTRTDTINAVRTLLQSGVELLLFAGGDGTACDIFSSLDSSTPILGIPAGVKMHSAVFANSPVSAGRLLSSLVQRTSPSFPIKSAEIMDLDEDARRRDSIQTTIIGYANVPVDRARMQSSKAYGFPEEIHAIDSICKFLVQNLTSGASYIVGPGTTTQSLLARMGIKGTLLGIDVVQDKTILHRDLNESQLLRYADKHPIKIIVGVIGGQGFLFGRGNQQITAEVIKRAGKENIIVVSSSEKILSLENQRLLVDTGDPKVDAELSGYIKVQVEARKTMIVKVEPA